MRSTKSRETTFLREPAVGTESFLLSSFFGTLLGRRNHLILATERSDSARTRLQLRDFWTHVVVDVFFCFLLLLDATDRRREEASAGMERLDVLLETRR